MTKQLIRNGIPVTPDLSSMPQNELSCFGVKRIIEGITWGYMRDALAAAKSTGILAEMAELTENRD